MMSLMCACMGTHEYGQIPLSNSLSAWLFDTNTPCDTKNFGAQPQTPRKRHLLPRPFIKFILDTPLSEFLRPPCNHYRYTFAASYSHGTRTAKIIKTPLLYTVEHVLQYQSTASKIRKKRHVHRGKLLVFIAQFYLFTFKKHSFS